MWQGHVASNKQSTRFLEVLSLRKVFFPACVIFHRKILECVTNILVRKNVICRLWNGRKVVGHFVFKYFFKSLQNKI
ncbi:hypothetical protein GDO78_000669 [Eleutherodactylus coqui]|uniref:Uncharacterized protein n=1 Tax=Eleutherodactylus coqui TaxID=57060 RepID=A0A8J6KHZ9_ELECQ|nr:hypothetical protein GDO78_000669 [Eleutherodactylus coqui]